MNDARIPELLSLIPESVGHLSGNPLYSGLTSWTNRVPVYILGLNPGGAPGPDTVAGNAEVVLRDLPADYNEYRDGVWSVGGRAASDRGQAPLQRRVRHLLDRLGLAEQVPASNIVFARSRQAAHINPAQMAAWAEDCWPFHSDVINRLGVRVIACLGQDAGRFVRSKVQAHHLVETYSENNRRGWKSFTYAGPGPTVVSLSHPGRADWTHPDSDPTGLVVRALAASRHEPDSSPPVRQ